MRDENTYIKLYRKTMTNEFLMKDGDAFNLFVKILLLCDRKTGSLKAGRKFISNICNMPERRVYNKIELLKKYGFITVKSNTHGSEIFVSNWSKYQSSNDEKSGKPVVNQWTTKNEKVVNQPELLETTEVVNQDDVSGKPVVNQWTHNKNKELINNNISEVQELNKPVKKKKDDRDVLAIINRVTGRNFRVEPTGIGKTKKQFTDEEIERALKNMYKDEWHAPLMKDLKIGYLLRADTIDQFVNFEAKKKTGSFIRGTTHKTDPKTMPIQDKELTPEQVERGILIRRLLDKGKKFSGLSSKTNAELKEILASV